LEPGKPTKIVGPIPLHRVEHPLQPLSGAEIGQQQEDILGTYVCYKAVQR
jgi:hypothetical protein